MARIRSLRDLTPALRRPSLVVLIAMLVALPAQAVFISVSLPGTSLYDGFDEMTFMNWPGYGNFPGAGLWPAPITPNLPGSNGLLDFDKVSGNGYPAGSSLYAPFTNSEFEIVTAAATPFDLETVVFQVDMGPGTGLLTFFDAEPVLSYNGGTQQLVPNFEEIGAGDYPFTNPTNPLEMGTTSAFAYQWDLRGLGSITSYQIEWTTFEHAQMYEFQVDVGDTFALVVPEPGSSLMLGTGIGALLLIQRRRERRSA